jgi:hypothetical protein
LEIAFRPCRVWRGWRIKKPKTIPKLVMWNEKWLRAIPTY